MLSRFLLRTGRNHYPIHHYFERNLTDRSFRLANITDLSVASKYKHDLNSNHYAMFAHTSDIKPREIEKQTVIDLSHNHGYKRGHIPSAINLGLERFDFSRLIDSPLDNTSITYEEIYELFNEELGINNDTSEIILYDNNGFLACRAFFVLRYFGFTNVRILNGGWRAWLKAGFPIDSNEHFAIPSKSKMSLKQMRKDIIKKPSDVIAYHKQLMNSTDGKKKICFVDTRNPETYNIYHIENAINIPSKLFMEEAQFKSVEQIRDIIKKRNIELSDFSHIILYSDKRLSASVGYFALTMAGIDSCSLYDAGIYNWISNYETSTLSDDAVDYLQR